MPNHSLPRRRCSCPTRLQTLDGALVLDAPTSLLAVPGRTIPMGETMSWAEPRDTGMCPEDVMPAVMLARVLTANIDGCTSCSEASGRLGCRYNEA